MKIALLTYGSHGDVEPFSALAWGLVQAGHQVRLAAPQYFESLINTDKIDFVGFPGNPQQLVQDLVDQAGNKWWRMVTSMSNFVLPLAVEVNRKARAACEEADLIVHSFLLTNTGYEIARELNIPDISAQTFPVFTSTGAFPAPVAPDLPLGGFYRRLTHDFVTQTFWQGSRLIWRWARRKNPQLAPLTGWPFNTRNDWQTPILYAFSPNVVPRPGDWPENVHITGYWFSNNSGDWKPDQKLVDFINAGPPPITIAFGSTSSRKMKSVNKKVQEALSLSNQRGVIVGNSHNLENPSHIYFQTEYIPYDWLFKRSAAVIHHGGAGTTGKALKAGIPNIVLPFTSDQPFWGRRVDKLGAGPKPIPPKRLTAVHLAEAIDSAINDQLIKGRVKKIGEDIASEDGVAQAVKIIQNYRKTVN